LGNAHFEKEMRDNINVNLEEVGETDSGSCPLAGYGISCVEPSGTVALCVETYEKLQKP
jgi:hypothetical protein